MSKDFNFNLIGGKKMKKLVVLLGLIFCFGIAAPSLTFAINIDSEDIIDGQVMTVDIADGAVTDAEITGPISASKIEKAANVVVVAKSGGDFTSIQSAIDSITPTSSNRYLLKVMPGTYQLNQDIILKSYIHIQGAGPEAVILETTSNNVFFLQNLSDVGISGFTLKGATYSIENDNSSPMITGNIFQNNMYGIRNTNASSPNITGNIFRDNGTGIINYGSSTPNISSNIFKNNVTGIRNVDAAYPTITNNILTGNDVGSGIYSTNESGATIIGNSISGFSTAISNQGSSSSSKIIGNNIFENLHYGIRCTSGATIIGNIITNNGDYGIIKSGAANPPKILNNTITGNGILDVWTYLFGTAYLSFNEFDSIDGTYTGSYNVKSDGTLW